MNFLRKVIKRKLLCQHKAQVPGIRTLFTQESLGITAYAANRELELSYTTQPDQFKREFLEKIRNSVPLPILIDNLKKYLHLMSNHPDDIELLWKALRLVQIRRDQLRRKSETLPNHKDYTFGPTAIRALHYHNLPEYAIKFFDDGNITNMFNQLKTYQVLLDLLYDRRMYGDVLRIFDEIQKRTSAQKQYISSGMYAIIFATYYRLNTPIHNALAFNLYNKLKQCGMHTKQYRKSIALVAAMKLKNNQPEESLEILSIHDDIDVNIRYIRILSYANLHQFNEVFRLLEMTIASKHNDKPILIPDDLLKNVENKLYKLRDNTLSDRYKLIFNELKRLDLIFYKSLKDILCARFPTNMAPYTPSKKFDLGCF